jgi:hypothetical protein
MTTVDPPNTPRSLHSACALVVDSSGIRRTDHQVLARNYNDLDGVVVVPLPFP